MDKDLRKVTKVVNWYLFMVGHNPMELKKDPKSHLADTNEIKEYLDNYIAYDSALLELYCKALEKVAELPKDNFLSKLERKIYNWYVCKVISQLEDDLFTAGVLLGAIEEINVRLNQFDKLLSC